jgi:hypothetical protein
MAKTSITKAIELLIFLEKSPVALSIAEMMKDVESENLGHLHVIVHAMWQKRQDGYVLENGKYIIAETNKTTHCKVIPIRVVF